MKLKKLFDILIFFSTNELTGPLLLASFSDVVPFHKFFPNNRPYSSSRNTIKDFEIWNHCNYKYLTSMSFTGDAHLTFSSYFIRTHGSKWYYMKRLSLIR